MEAARPLLERSPAPIPRFLLDEKLTRSLAEGVPFQDVDASSLPPASFTYAKEAGSGDKLPQIISHRGYRAAYPENTMAALKGAVDAGAHAIETDIHLTKDDVVVLSHDATLKRCFGIDKKIIDCDWDYVRQQRTLDTPSQPMPRLRDLLEYIAQSSQEHIWLLLDVKIDNDPENVMRLIATTIASVPPSKSRPWGARILLGLWAAKWLPICTKHLPGFSVTHIGFSIPYARQFLPLPNISFNFFVRSLSCPIIGPRFLRECKKRGRPVYAWTVNDVNTMKWCIVKGVDGVITDDPKRFRRVCVEWEQGRRGVDVGLKEWVMIAWQNLVILLVTWMIWWRLGKITKGGESGNWQNVPTPAPLR